MEICRITLKIFSGWRNLGCREEKIRMSRI